jgi:hypothetical protein
VQQKLEMVFTNIPFFTFIWISFVITINGNITDIAQAYSDDSLYEKAIEKAKTNERVLEVLGAIEPIDKLALFEGNAFIQTIIIQ